MSYAGGFLQGSQGGSQGSPGSKRSGPSALRPVTIHQISTAQQAHPEAEFYLDGQELKEITFVACVRNMSRGTTNIGYLVEDGTGQIDARQWVDNAGEENEQSNEIEVNTYIRVLGSIKTFSGKRSVNCTRVRVIEDMNEINFHLVEAAYVSMYHQKGGLPGAAGGGRADHSHIQAPYAADAANPYAAAGGGGGGGNQYSDLPVVQRRIMEFIAQEVASGESDDGVNVGAIHRGAGGNTSLDKVKMELETLIGDGHLYQTIDDDHVLPTN
ncbi:hypothetical protein BCR35DRAFT_309268 [Leucosporidium creatinivorum]|uniref:Replication protein A C-terminal domain-containing protein n=1 Tax=Leucosporidium creatinivorum TaxID=106004 RepID=A0A1Y2DJK2_9BASI|nr:hypothetical protein BCR35DRAFT_309268 [Leucosporidium creatinivorum]